MRVQKPRTSPSSGWNLRLIYKGYMVMPVWSFPQTMSGESLTTRTKIYRLTYIIFDGIMGYRIT